MKYDLLCMPMKKTKKTIRTLKEELNSRIEIQERSLQAYSKEIFENVGQVLSLVKLQLLVLQEEDKNYTEKVTESGKLLGKAIADLRNLTKQLSPDEIIKNGFASAINYELKRLNETGFCHAELSVSGNFIKLEEVKELVVFCVLQQLTYPILNIHETGIIRMNISYKKSKIEIEVAREYREEPLFLNIEEMAKFKQRLITIESSISYKDQDLNTLRLTINI